MRPTLAPASFSGPGLGLRAPSSDHWGDVTLLLVSLLFYSALLPQGGGLSEDAVDVAPGTQPLGPGSNLGKTGMSTANVPGDLVTEGDKHQVRMGGH